MSKELEALNTIIYGYGYDKNVEIVSKALEDYETLKILNENQKHNIEMLVEENRIQYLMNT